MTTTTELWDEGRPPGLGPIVQIKRAFGLMQAHLVPVLVLWVLLSVAAYGSFWAMTQYGLGKASALAPAYLGYALASAIVSALLSGALLRVLLGPAPAPDRGFLTYLGIIVAVSFVTAAGAKLIGGPTPDAADQAAAMAALGRQLILLVAFLIWAYVAVKLMLWPIGVLVGDAEVTPGVSWARTRGAFWGYILGMVLLNVIPWAILAFFGFQSAQAGHPGDMPPLAAPFAGLMALFGTSLAAAVYDLRRREAAEAAA